MNKILHLSAALAFSTSALAFSTQVVHAACIAGPSVTVNRGHGASITFDEPVYQAQIFDPSRLILQPIPQQGTSTLLLSQVDTQNFPGMPQTPTTSLVAQTANGCYSFQVSYGDSDYHVSVSATAAGSSTITPGTERLLPGGEDIDLTALRDGYELAVSEHGEDNIFLQRVARFLELTEQGASQRLTAQQVSVQWSHLQALAQQGASDLLLLIESDTIGI